MLQKKCTKLTEAGPWKQVLGTERWKSVIRQGFPVFSGRLYCLQVRKVTDECRNGRGRVEILTQDSGYDWVSIPKIMNNSCQKLWFSSETGCLSFAGTNPVETSAMPNAVLFVVLCFMNSIVITKRNPWPLLHSNYVKKPYEVCLNFKNIRVVRSIITVICKHRSPRASGSGKVAQTREF